MSGGAAGEATAERIARIVSRLESRALDPAPEGEECGPFLQRLLLTVEETRVDGLLDDIISRAHATFAPLAQTTVAAGDDAEALMADVASRASRLVIAEALQPSAATTTTTTTTTAFSSPPSSESLSRVQQAAWCRIGQLSLRLIRESTSGIQSVWGSGISDGGAQQVPVLLQRRLAWGSDAKDGSESEARSCGRGDSPMVSGFTLQWGAVLLFLHLLADAAGLSSSVGGACTVSPSRDSRHPLPHIVADSVTVMMERNHFLLQQARDTKQIGTAAELLNVAANNFAWIQRHCGGVAMSDALEVAELLTQSLAVVLQDIIDGLVEELRCVLLMYIAPCGVSGGGERRGMTHRVLAARIAASCGLFSGMAHALPRREMMSLVLEQSLWPALEQLLEGEKQPDTERGYITTGVLRRVGDIFLPAEALAKHAAATHIEAAFAAGGGGGATLAQRLSEALQLLEAEEAFGAVLCERSPPFRTLRRLLPSMTP
ncbi:putative ankyrin repeat protein [Trypanosoma conorhini]|uniref:Putative ankyrin repeat protein n=1 Tax=Trypanosoma conorhini TaxID=83891 RepID=A0A3R7PL57_9TRYP|nr:putative ankyrin repeat protein [Trypanosoma conorhini]RNF26991.1 putative ankyrin repeat protein [Trypanosoma conorhini]